MKRFNILFSLIALLLLSSCEDETYYFDKFAGNTYKGEMQGSEITISFQGDNIIILCGNGLKQTLVQSWGSNTPDLYIFELNNFIFDIVELPDGSLKGWYYTYGNNPNSNEKTEIILCKVIA